MPHSDSLGLFHTLFRNPVPQSNEQPNELVESRGLRRASTLSGPFRQPRHPFLP